jgi:hypothetical protein
LVPATPDVEAPENALHEASFVGEKNEDADAVKVSPPLVNVLEDMYGEGGNCVHWLLM